MFRSNWINYKSQYYCSNLLHKVIIWQYVVGPEITRNV